MFCFMVVSSASSSTKSFSKDIVKEITERVAFIYRNNVRNTIHKPTWLLLLKYSIFHYL
jgi:hypothetical protein